VGVRIIYNRDGRPSGDAVAEFESDDQAEAAMGKNREHLGSRFVILTREDGGSGGGSNQSFDNGSSNGSSSGGRFSVRMGGLPYRATVNEIIDWFRPEAECAHVRIIMNREGRPSGEAVAEFDTKEMAEQAMVKNRQYLKDRFVILTPQY
jgi:RNA recognition motif-containing protein